MCALLSMRGDPDWARADRAADESDVGATDELRDEDVVAALQDVDTGMFN